MESERGYPEARRLLKEHFGNGYIISMAYIDKALDWLRSFGSWLLYLTGCCEIARTKGDTLCAFSNPCLFCQGGQHAMEKCKKMKKSHYKAKIDFLKSKGLCFSCLKQGHMSKACQEKMSCQVCQLTHPTVLHIKNKAARSEDMKCGMCMEVVLEKTYRDQRRFGILSNCSHCYCLKCIRKWRSAMQFESKIIKSCPGCQIPSNFVIPSDYWVEDKEDKQKLIQKYKDGMGKKPCQYFDEGRGTCRFGSNCIYKHAFPDGGA